MSPCIGGEKPRTDLAVFLTSDESDYIHGDLIKQADQIRMKANSLGLVPREERYGSPWPQHGMWSCVPEGAQRLGKRNLTEYEECTMKTYLDKASERRLVETPAPKEKSKVAIVKAADYSQAEKAVREAVRLLGGVKAFVKPTDKVIIKPNMIAATKPEEGEVTNPAMVEAVVKVFKETGAYVRVGEQTGWHGDPLTTFKVTGMYDAAMRGGADGVVNWDQDDYVDTPVPNGRCFGVVKLPRSLVEADVIINVPKMKTNLVQVVTLGIKSWIGALHNSQRTFIHKNQLDNGFTTIDVVKALGPRLKLNILDGIEGMEGSGPHAGLVTKPGIVLASSDVVAFSLVGCAIMGFHPMEVPAHQAGMKDGVGTADLREIEILGSTIEEVKHPYLRPVPQVVNRYPNVMEFVGGACPGCQWTINSIPPYVDPDKKYAIVVGARAMIGQDLANFDEVWLSGICGCAASHQLPGFDEKLARAKKVIRVNNCPGYNVMIHYHQDPASKGEVYSVPNLWLADMVAFWTVPDVTNEAKLEAAIARRDKKMDLEQFMKGCNEYYGEQVVCEMKPLDWGIHPLKGYANVDKEWPEPECKVCE